MPLYQHNTIDWYDWLKLTFSFLFCVCICFFIQFRFLCQHFPIPLKIHLYCHQSRQYFRWICSNTIARQCRARLFVRSCFAWFHLRWCVCVFYSFITSTNYSCFKCCNIHLTKWHMHSRRIKRYFCFYVAYEQEKKNKPYQSCKNLLRKKTTLKFNSWKRKNNREKMLRNEVFFLCLLITKHRCHICDEMNGFFFILCAYI